MTAGERGFLLLSSHLGDPERRCLSPAQFRELAARVRSASPQTDLRDLAPRDLTVLGYGGSFALRIIELLSQETLLDRYSERAKREDCSCLTRLSDRYPQSLRARLGLDAPGCLWYKGDSALLDQPMVALVGNRDLREKNEGFAHETGLQAARQGLVLVSGNARGADRTAQNACLNAGGSVISVVADGLTDHWVKPNVLYLSEDSFDLPFTTYRALSRNRIIHALTSLVLVAQCDEPKGGTWDGTVKNLRGGWSRVACCADDTDGIRGLCELGAQPIEPEQLSDLPSLAQPQPSLFDLL